MGYSPDVLATALQELIPGYSETFTQWSPAFDQIVKAGNKETAQGPWCEFVLVPEGPGQVTTLVTGNESIAGGRRQSAVRGNTYASDMIYAYDVPGKDLREANGEQDLADLIKRYPERALMDFHELIARQLVMGDAPGVSGFPTWNGDATYNPRGVGARAGHFEYADVANQTDTVFGVAKNSIQGWVNQRRHISSFATNGRLRMRQLMMDCVQQGSKQDGEVKLVFADRGTFDNYLEDLDDQIQFMDTSNKGDGGHASGNRGGIPILGAKMYSEAYIKPADISGSNPDAQNGIAYFINPATWHLFTMGHNSGMETKGDFEARGPIRHPTQDLWRYEWVLSMGMYCDNLRLNGVLTGGATP